MEASLLTTKMFIPPTKPGLVNRPRLLEKIQAVLDYPWTLISAPAGFGKTTLLSEWIHYSHPHPPTAWLSLEEAENDPAKFWDYFIAALKTLNPGVGKISSLLLHSPQPVPVEAFLTELINESNTFLEDFVLVLDDYHFIQSPLVHIGLTFLLERLPPKMHLVVATRVDPPLPLTHFRGKGNLLEIRADDLRFTLEEATALVRNMNAPDLSLENVKALNTRTEAWVVGLKMAVLSLRREKDTAGFISHFAGSQRYVMDYLLEEVFEAQPTDTREFLLKISVMEKFTGTLCDLVTGRTDGQIKLGSLERDNLFIVPLDASGEWYRYEHLFGEFLRHRLEVEYGKDLERELQTKVSKWYENKGFLEDAVHYTLAAQNWEEATRLISIPGIWGTRWLRWRAYNMYDWLRQIPEEVLRKDRNLYLSYIRALDFVGQYDIAETHIEYLEQASSQDNQFLGMLAAVRTNIALDRGDSVHVEQHAKRALSLLPPEDAHTRGLVSMMLGGDYLTRDKYIEAEPLMAQAYESFSQMKDIFRAASLKTYLAVITMLRGNLHQAENMLNEVIIITEQKDAVSDSSAWSGFDCNTLMYLSMIHYEWNDLEKAASEQERAVELYRLLRGSYLVDQINLWLVRICLAQGDIQRAAEILEQTDRVIAKGGENSYDRARNLAYHVALAVAQEDAEAVSNWVAGLGEYEDYLKVDSPFCARRLLYMRKGKAAAREQLEKDYARFTGLPLIEILIRLSQALLADTSDQIMVFLSEALAAGKKIGAVRAFVDQGMELVPLLRKAINRDIEPEYARTLLDIIEAEKRQRKVKKEGLNASTPSSSLLSERELEVLKLLEAGLSNQQIAKKLFITLSTAKAHVHNILQKLNATSRTNAITLAREFKLL